MLLQGFQQHLEVPNAEVQLADLYCLCCRCRGRRRGRGSSGSMFPQEISKIELSKMQFAAFAGLELDNQESLLRQKKKNMLTIK